MNDASPHVGLFVTCLVDLFRPTVGFATVSLLEKAGCRVSVPSAQTCCGQPAYNSGDRTDSQAIARQTIEAFRDFDYVVVPSGSCAGMIKVHYSEMFADDPGMLEKAEALAAKTWELTQFLVRVRGWTTVDAAYEGTATYHDSCSSLREHNVKEEPRTLLARVQGLAVEEMAETEICCGFGGTFCVKYPEISNRMVHDKARNVLATGADTLLAGDLGCLMNIAGKLHREGAHVACRHVAEVLAGMTDAPAIGEDEA